MNSAPRVHAITGLRISPAKSSSITSGAPRVLPNWLSTLHCVVYVKGSELRTQHTRVAFCVADFLQEQLAAPQFQFSSRFKSASSVFRTMSNCGARLHAHLGLGSFNEYSTIDLHRGYSGDARLFLSLSPAPMSSRLFWDDRLDTRVQNEFRWAAPLN